MTPDATGPGSTQLPKSAARRPVRALFFSPTLGTGGAEMQILRLLKALDRTQIAPSVSVARGGGSYEARLPEDVPLHTCSRGIRSSLAGMAAAVLPLRRHIQETHPDVVVSLLEHAHVAVRCAVAGLRQRPHIVCGIQNNFESTLRDTPLALRTGLRPFYLNAYRRADRIVALSGGVAGDLASLLPEVSSKMTTIYNAGVDSDLPQLARVPLDEPRPEAPLLVACGRLNVQKDYPTMLEALALLPTRAHLWVLGTGPLEQELRHKATALGIDGRVRWLGFQNNPYRYMAQADAFLLSSQWEGFANVVAEALACGTPVVSTDCPHGPGEILDRGHFGRLTPVGDVQALASAIEQTLNEGKTPQIQRRCRERAQFFSASRSATSYATALCSVVGASAEAALQNQAPRPHRAAS